MATNKDLVQYIADQMARAGEVTFKKMFGEYGLLFYHSTTFQLLQEGVADLHCRSDLYLADELMMEYP